METHAKHLLPHLKSGLRAKSDPGLFDYIFDNVLR